MASKKVLLGVLVLFILSTSAYIIFNEQVKLQVSAASTTLYLRENNTWVVAGVESNKLYNGSSIVGVTTTEDKIETIYDTNLNTSSITRWRRYKSGSAIRDTYTFDGKVNDVAAVPLEHKIEIFNASGLIYDYYVSKLPYTGMTTNIVGNSIALDKNVKVEWDIGSYYAKITSTGILNVKWKVNNSYLVLKNRLFDPAIILNETGQNIGDSYVSYNSIDNCTGNFGTSSDLYTLTYASGGASKATYMTIIKFNISSIPSGASVTDAELTLYSVQHYGNDNIAAYYVYNPLNTSSPPILDWNETGVNGTNAPPIYSGGTCAWWSTGATPVLNATNMDTTALDTITTTGVGFWTWNVTKAIQVAYNEGRKNVTIYLQQTTPESGGNKGDRWLSKEYADYKPKLNVTISASNTTLLINNLNTNRSYEHGTNVSIYATGPTCIDINQTYRGVNYFCHTGNVINTTYLMDSATDTFEYGTNMTAGNLTFSKSMCYQEYANISTSCGGLSTGLYANSSNLIYINYTKPSGSVQTGSVWQVAADNYEAANYTIPLDCWNTNAEIISFRFTSQSNGPHGYCLNGTSWINITQQVSITGLDGTWDNGETLWKKALDGDWGTSVAYLSGDWAENVTGKQTSHLLKEEAMWWNMTTIAIDAIYSRLHTFDDINYANIILKRFASGGILPVNITIFVNNTKVFSNKANSVGNPELHNTMNLFIVNKTTTGNTSVSMSWNSARSSQSFSVSAFNGTVRNASFRFEFLPSGEQWSPYSSNYATYSNGPFWVNVSQALDSNNATFGLGSPDGGQSTYLTKYVSIPTSAALVKNISIVTIYYLPGVGYVQEGGFDIWNYTGNVWSRYQYPIPTVPYPPDSNSGLVYNVTIDKWINDTIRDNQPFTYRWNSQGGGWFRYYESYISFNYSVNQTGKVYVDIGSDGVYDYRFENISTNVTITNITAFQNYVTKHCQFACIVPISIISTDLIGGTIRDINMTFDNNIFINGSIYQSYLGNSTEGWQKVPIKIESDVGIWEISQYNLSYNGNDNITFTAHSFDTNISLYANVYHSPYNYSFPKNIQYLEFIPPTPTDKNVSAFGQSVINPILKFLTRGYGMNMNISIKLNETYPCVNLTINNVYNPGNATVLLNTSWISLGGWTNLSIYSNVSLYIWAQYSCNSTGWQLFNPDLQVRGCGYNTVCEV